MTPMTSTTATLPVALLGEEYEISAGPLRASVREVGAALRTLRHGDDPLVDGFDADGRPGGGHGQQLVPWPNRIADGRYTFAGEQRQLDLSEPAKHNAIHGLARWRNWLLAERGPDRLLLTHRLHHHPGYPHVLDLAVEYTLDEGTGLTVRTTATNVGATTAPYGCGAHPYLTAGTPRIDDCELHVPAGTWLPTDERGIPRGAEPVAGSDYDFRHPRRIGALRIDYAYGDLERDGNGQVHVTLRAPGGRAVTLWLDEAFRWVEIFTGDTLPEPDAEHPNGRRRTGLGVEPMTCPPNGFATGEGVLRLAPGASATATWGIGPAG
jgi:aldose 1-epimerase